MYISQIPLTSPSDLDEVSKGASAAGKGGKEGALAAAAGKEGTKEGGEEEEEEEIKDDPSAFLKGEGEGVLAYAERVFDKVPGHLSISPR